MPVSKPADPRPYAVSPTQPWLVCAPESGLTHVQAPAAQGGAALGSYVRLFARTTNDQVYAQRIIVNSSSEAGRPWSLFLQGAPEPLVDSNGIHVRSQAPPVAFSSHDLIFLIFSGASDDESRIYMSRFNGSAWAPITMQFKDQFVAPGRSPCVAALDDKVFLAWPGAGFNGYFYCIGTLGAPDEFGATISWGPVQVVPGTHTWVMDYNDRNRPVEHQPTAMAFKTDSASGFVFLTWKMPSLVLRSAAEADDAQQPGPGNFDSGFWYFVFDNATGAFTHAGPTAVPLGASGLPSPAVIGGTLVAARDLAVPVLVDDVGNITYYQLDNQAPNYGSFADWVQCAIGGAGGDVTVSVGIPPSISISTGIDHSPFPMLSAMTIYPGVSGGALICSQFYNPAIGSNSVGFAAVALHLRTLDPP